MIRKMRTGKNRRTNFKIQIIANGFSGGMQKMRSEFYATNNIELSIILETPKNNNQPAIKHYMYMIYSQYMIQIMYTYILYYLNYLLFQIFLLQLIRVRTSISHFCFIKRLEKISTKHFLQHFFYYNENIFQENFKIFVSELPLLYDFSLFLFIFFFSIILH